MSQGMTARLAWALLTALGGGVWLCLRQSRRASDSSSSSSRVVLWLRGFVLLVCLFWSLTWLLLAMLRLRYPYELEWIGGAMRDHCERILTGRALYVAPGPDWFPYEYPPLYTWTCALIMRLCGGASYVAMRLVSIGSTLGCAALIWIWVRRLVGEGRAGNIWGAIAAGLFLASYRLTGAWYDVERLDMLFLFLSLLGIVWLGEGLLWTALSAVALALAFFTKQQAVLFIFGGIAALTWRLDLRQAGCFAGVSLVACLLPALALNIATQGWFGYYCFKVPLSNGVQLHLARQYFLGDLPLFAPVIAILALGGWKALRRTPQESSARSGSGDSILVAMTLMGLAGSLLSRAHWGGDQNVLMTGFLFLGTGTCVVAGRWERIDPATRAPLYALLLAQLLTLTYRPSAQLPTSANLQAGRRFVQTVRALEKQGEVLCLDHGNITVPRHFQIMGLLDVLNTDKRLPPDLIAAFRAHRFTAILTDSLPGQDSLFGAELYRDYAPAECLHFNATWTVTGYPTPGPTHPVWVMRPRRTPEKQG